MLILITTVHVIVCFFLIIVVLLQSGKSGDIAAGSTVIFMVTSITLSVMASRGAGSSSSIVQGLNPSQTKTQPATPAPASPPQK